MYSDNYFEDVIFSMFMDVFSCADHSKVDTAIFNTIISFYQKHLIRVGLSTIFNTFVYKKLINFLNNLK